MLIQTAAAELKKSLLPINYPAYFPTIDQTLEQSARKHLKTIKLLLSEMINDQIKHHRPWNLVFRFVAQNEKHKQPNRTFLLIVMVNH